MPTPDQTDIMRLGAAPNAAQPTPFPYVLYWDTLGRKGQRCEMVFARNTSQTCRVRFTDGFEAVLNRRAIRLAK